MYRATGSSASLLTFTDHRHSVDEHVLYAGGIVARIIKL